MRSRIFPWKLISAARKFKLLCCPATVSSVLLQEFSQWFISSPFHPQVCPSHSPPGWSPSPSLVWLGQSWLSPSPNSPICLGPVCPTRLGWSTQIFSFSLAHPVVVERLSRLSPTLGCVSSSVHTC